MSDRMRLLEEIRTIQKEGDLRLLSHERKLLTPVDIMKTTIHDVEIEDVEIFVNEDLQMVWDQALQKDQSFIKIIQAVLSDS